METDPTKFKGISDELLKDGLNVRINTLGASMYPLISTGDKITINPSKTYKIGDMLVFKRDDQMVCHRLVRIFKKDDVEYYQTCGDNHFGLDEPVCPDKIIGKVIKIERQHVSVPRKLLLSIYPILRLSYINPAIISILMHIRKTLKL